MNRPLPTILMTKDKERLNYSIHLKGTVSRDFLPLFFSSNCTPGSLDSWAKTVLHIDSNSRSNSIRFNNENRLLAMPHSWESQLCAIWHFFNTLHYMQHRTESELSAMRHSMESQLCAMRHSAESTPPCAA
jgi:hypothetical protein